MTLQEFIDTLANGGVDQSSKIRIKTWSDGYEIWYDNGWKIDTIWIPR